MKKLVVGEQILTTAYNFLLGAFVAKILSMRSFGEFVSIVSLYYVLSSFLVSMTISVYTTDLIRLKRARSNYLKSAAIVSFLPIVGVSAFGCIGVIVVSSTLSNSLMLILEATLYIFCTLSFDVLKRIFFLSGIVRPILAISAMRAVVLVLFSAIAFLRGMALDLEDVFLFVAVLSLVCMFLLMPLAEFEISSRRLIKVVKGRTIRVGWLLGMSSVVSSGFEQAIAVYSGMRYSPSVVGGWRAGSYLFGVISPFLQTIDILVPSRFNSIKARSGLRLAIRWVAALSVIACGLIAAVGILNGTVWLSMLGEDYSAYSSVSYFYVFVYMAIVLRSILSSFVRTAVPRAMLIGAVVGSLSGLCWYFFSLDSGANLIAQAVLVANSVSFFVLLMSTYIYRKSFKF